MPELLQIQKNPAHDLFFCVQLVKEMLYSKVCQETLEIFVCYMTSFDRCSVLLVTEIDKGYQV